MAFSLKGQGHTDVSVASPKLGSLPIWKWVMNLGHIEIMVAISKLGSLAIWTWVMNLG